MAYDETLAARIRSTLGEREELVERKMFGGIAFMLRGNMCCGVHKESLMLRLGHEIGVEALSDPRMRPFDITGKPMKGWVLTDPARFEDNDELAHWIAQALKFASSLPPK